MGITLCVTHSDTAVVGAHLWQAELLGNNKALAISEAFC